MGLDMTGIIAGALGGGAQAVQGMAQDAIHHQQKQDLFDHEQQALSDRAMALKQWEVNSANQQRDARNARIDRAQGGIVDGIMNKRYAGSDASVAAAAGGVPADQAAGTDQQAQLTPEQAAIIAQAKGNDRDNLNANPQVRLQALRGEMSPDHEAQTNATLQRAELQNDRARYGIDTKTGSAERVANIRADGARDVGEGHDDARRDTTQARIDARTTADKSDVTLDRQYESNRKIVQNANAVAADPLQSKETKAAAAADAVSARGRMVEIDATRKARAREKAAAPAGSAPAAAAPSAYPSASAAAADFMKKFAPARN